MNVQLKPEVQRFVEQQVEAGNFGSPEELLEEAVAQMMVESESELDEETVAAINRAEKSLDRGEGIEFGQFAAEWRKKIEGE